MPFKKLINKMEDALGVDINGDGKVGTKPPRHSAPAGHHQAGAQQGYPASTPPQGYPQYQNPHASASYGGHPQNQGGYGGAPQFSGPYGVQPGGAAPPYGGAPQYSGPYGPPSAGYPQPSAPPMGHAGARADPGAVQYIQGILPGRSVEEISRALEQNSNNRESALNSLLNSSPKHMPPKPQYSAPPPAQHHHHQPQHHHAPPQHWGGGIPFPGWSQWVSQRHPAPPTMKMGQTWPAQTNQPPPRPSGRKKAVLIGINYKGTSAALRGCLNDVHHMKDLLMRHGFQDSDSTMLCLVDDARDRRYQPTRDNIESAMQWLLAGVQPGDVLFFHYSGHGAQRPDPNAMEEDGMDETILPVDFKKAGMISDTQIFATLVFPLPPGVRLVSVMDCCHSGTGLDLPFTLSRSNQRWSSDTNPMHSQGDVVLFSASADAQTAADASLEGRPGGAMTTAFVGALQKNPRQTYLQLIDSVANIIRQRGYPQKPQLTSSQAFDPSRIFGFEDIHPNTNPEIGCKMNKRIKHRQPLQFGGGFGNLLLGAGIGLLAANAIGGGIGVGAELLGGVLSMFG